MNAIAYRPGSARDRASLAELLRSLSPQSSYARFQAALGPDVPCRVLDALLPDGVRGGSVLAWDAGRLVGHGVWVRVGSGRVAEIALVVTDTHQDRGIGTDLAERLLVAAAARGMDRVEVFSAGGNRAVARMVSRRAPAAEKVRDGAAVGYSFGLEESSRAGDPGRPRAA